jgi:hypothetical protein
MQLATPYKLSYLVYVSCQLYITTHLIYSLKMAL